MHRLLQADESDVTFMADLVVGMARDGYLYEGAADQREMDRVRNDMLYIVQHGTHSDGQRRAQAMVLEYDDERVAFAVVSEFRSGAGGNELLLIGVAAQKRGQGHGAYLLDQIDRHWAAVDLYVHCRPRAEAMLHMLSERGFEWLETDEYGARLMRRPARQP